MNKFLIKIAIFFSVMIIADFIFGKLMYYIESQSSSKNYHCMYEADEDVLILGSSYAVRNIVPSVIEDSLRVTCYNAGEAGNGIIAAWARYNMFIKQHRPKLIIYTLTPNFDYIKSDEYSKYLNSVKPYYGKDESVVKMYEDLMNWSDGFVLKSNFVKFNSYGAQLISHWLTKKNMGLQGYEPLYETFIPYEKTKTSDMLSYEIDYPKMSYIEKLFINIKKYKIQMICILPPVYHKDLNIADYKEGLELCKMYNIPVINHKYYDGISQNAQYFYDIGHLNDKGARLYTKLLCNELSFYLLSPRE